MNSPSSFSSICQYVGLQRDPTTAVSYPSPSNHCFHCQSPSTPTMEHQESYCLASTHVNCPIYHQSEAIAFPKELRYVHTENNRHGEYRSPVRQFLVVMVGTLLVGVLLWMGYQSFSTGWPFNIKQSMVITSVPTRFSPTDDSAKSVKFTELPTNTPIPATPTIQPTITSTEFPLQSHALDVPIMVGNQAFIMHRIVEGEQILFLTEQHHTTLKVLQWINNTPPVPLLVGKVIVIAPGLMTIDQSLPPFEPYQVTDKEANIEGLAGKLGVDLKKLEYYNRCSRTCKFVKGDWLLLPPRINPSIPYTSTPGPSSTPTTKTHALEVPILAGKQPLLMHRVLEGEQVIFLIKQYQTTMGVVRELNYKPAIPLWAGQVIIIAPGLDINIDPELPPFEPYQVTDKKISIEDLSTKLGANLDLLKYYNGCSNECQLVQGDWLLIPHPK